MNRESFTEDLMADRRPLKSHMAVAPSSERTNTNAYELDKLGFESWLHLLAV